VEGDSGEGEGEPLLYGHIKVRFLDLDDADAFLMDSTGEGFVPHLGHGVYAACLKALHAGLQQLAGFTLFWGC